MVVELLDRGRRTAGQPAPVPEVVPRPVERPPAPPAGGRSGHVPVTRPPARGRRPSSAAGAAPSVEIMGVRVHDVDLPFVVDHVRGALAEGRGGWVVTPNVDILRQLVADPALARLAEGADLSLPDGMPLVWASRLQGTPLRCRVAGSELFEPLCRAAAGDGHRVFLVGGEPGVAGRAAATLQRLTPGLVVSGIEAPPPGFERDPVEMTRLLRRLRHAQPDIVFCGLGFPKQERLMAVLTRALPTAWLIGCGGTFAMASGDVPAAPTWMRRHGLEWLHRLRLEPERLARRYLVDDLPFAVRLLASSACSGRRRDRQSLAA